MQSSLAIVLSLTLGFSPHPCVSIFGTGHIYLTLETFLGSSSTAFRTRRSFPYASRLLVSDGGFACHPDISLAPALPAAGCSFLSVIPSHIYGYRNLYLLSIDYAFRPRLRSRLTQSGRTFLWKPWVFGAWDSHPRSATHTGILSSMISTRPFGRTSPFMERSPTIPWDP